MIAQEYKKMLGAKSVIREMFTYGTERAKEIGRENVFDYSLGNPSVPVPEKFTKKMIELLETESPVALHGYSPSLGIDSVREAVAVSLEKRFGLPYKKEHILTYNIYMAIGQVISYSIVYILYNYFYDVNILSISVAILMFFLIISTVYLRKVETYLREYKESK